MNEEECTHCTSLGMVIFKNNNKQFGQTEKKLHTRVRSDIFYEKLFMRTYLTENEINRIRNKSLSFKTIKCLIQLSCLVYRKILT